MHATAHGGMPLCNRCRACSVRAIIMGNRRLIIIGAVALILGGCKEEGVKVYRVPKEPSSLTALAEQADRRAGAAPLTWAVPNGWNVVPPGSMRVASFKIAGPNGQEADVSVIPLAGGGGDDLSNVNRWRGQVGQPPITAEQLRQIAQPVEVAGQPAWLYEVEGGGVRTLAVIYRREGTGWFFKMTGSSELVVQQKQTFVEFVRGVKFRDA